MVGTSPDVRGGISTVVRGYQASGLFERFDIRYITSHRDGSALIKAGAALTAYLHLCWLLLVSDAPLVHIHLASRASFWRKSIVCALASAWRRPYVVHVHGAEFSKFYEQECGVFARRLVRAVLHRAALVLALSKQWQVDLKRIAPQAQVRTLPNAVSLAVSVCESEPRAPRILFSGRIGERKGTFELLNAFARLAPEFPDAVLVCAGDGDRDGLLRRAAELGCANRVTCPGWLSAEEMAVERRQASIFALPSHAEGVPMALLEAMACGLPVLTTPVGGIPEVVEHGVNGLLVQPGDVGGIEHALRELLSSAPLRARLGRAAHDTIAARFSLAAAIEQLAAIYRDFGLKDRNITGRAASS